MVLYFDPESKRESLEWRHPSEERPKKAKLQQSRGRSWLRFSGIRRGSCCAISNLKVPVSTGYTTLSYCEDYGTLSRRSAAGSSPKESCCYTTTHPSTQRRWQRLLSWSAASKRFHTPPYSPDMAPSDYYLFPKLKKDLRGQRFDHSSELHDAVLAHFEDKTSEYYYNEISQLYRKCEKCIEVEGSYIEK